MVSILTAVGAAFFGGLCGLAIRQFKWWGFKQIWKKETVAVA